jgi:hypothetical protein
MSRRILVIVLLLANALTTWAATPNRLGYQGNLADSGGNPITANLSISFRLYDVASGGSALWSETQPAVAVDGGNFSVELGSVTPLPKSMFGRQLYLGIQIAGDSEMMPRPALTAAPFALRAGRTAQNTWLVSADGSAVDNGAALAAALTEAATAASAANPVAVDVDAGEFDVGSTALVVASHVTLVGRGQSATIITGGQANNAVLRLDSFAAVRELSVRNALASTGSAIAIGAFGAGGTSTVVDGVRISHVTGESVAVADAAGNARHGLYVCMRDSRLQEVTGIGEGGANAFGLRGDCNDANGNLIDGAVLIANGSTNGLRGAYLRGGGPWQRIKVFINTNPSLTDVYGLRVFKSPLDTGAALDHFFVSIEGDSSPSTNAASNFVGLQVEGADITVQNGNIGIENAVAKNIRGLRYFAQSGEKSAKIQNVDMRVEGTQQGALGFGEIIGMRFDLAAGELRNIDIEVECIGQTYNYCGGFLRNEQVGADVQGPLTVENLTIDARTFTPADTSNQTQGFKSVGTVNLRHSSIRVTQSASELVGGVTSDSDQSSPFNTTPSLIAENTTVSVATSDGLFSACAGAVPNTGTGFEFYGNVLGGGICTTNPNLKCFGNVKRGAGGTVLGPNCNGASQ